MSERRDHELLHAIHRLEEIMSIVPSGLAAMQQAVIDLTATVAEATALIASLSAPNAEDAEVATLAASVEQQNAALKAALPTPQV